jgi:hypothetical protein
MHETIADRRQSCRHTATLARQKKQKLQVLVEHS